MNNTFQQALRPTAGNGSAVGHRLGASLLLTVFLVGGCAGEAPFVRSALDMEVRDKTQSSGEFNADPNDTQKQKSTSFYQTPQLPPRTRDVVGKAPPPALTKGSGEPVATLNLDSMPLPQFVQAVFGAILKLNVSMDPQVAQRTDMVSLRSGKPQSEEQIFAAAQAVLRSYGLAVNEFNGLVRVTPESGQSGYLPEIRRGRAMPDVPEGLRPIFYLAELESTNATQAVNWMRTLFQGRVTAAEDQVRNSIMLSGQSDAVRAALEALQLLDQPLMRGRLSARIVPVFWSADEMAKRLVEMLNAEGYAATQSAMTPAPILVLPIAPANSVVVFAANQNVLNHALQWAQELDQAPPGRGGGYITYHVRNTDATELATTLKEVMGESVAAAAVTTATTAGTTGTATSATVSPAGRSAGSKVVVNKSGNSLIIKTTPAEYQQWFGLLQELDRPSRTALIMATVAEVSLDDTDTFGFNWVLKQFTAAGFDVNTGTTDAVGTSATGFRIALGRSGDPRALLTALSTTNKSRILANPSVMTRNGETATIQVGDEVPLLTSQTSTVNAATESTSGVVQTQTIQYRSTGTVLKVRPVIHSGGRIEIDVSQEVSSAKSTKTGVDSSPTISTRKIDTKLTVSEGNTILLGGLISSTSSNGISGIPWLKDIPYVGALFRTSQEIIEKRTELVILLTPYIVEDDFDVRSVTDAFRNQFSWAKEIKPLQGGGETDPLAVKPSAAAGTELGVATVVPADVAPDQKATLQSSVGKLPADGSGPERRAATGKERALGGATQGKMVFGVPESTSETLTAYRSKPYVLPEMGAAPDVSAQGVAPLQQSVPVSPQADAPADVKQMEPVIDSPTVQDLPNNAGEARPVADEALKRELLDAIQGAASTGKQ